MPKFLVTSGSYFQPFTYDELAKPIVQTVEAHNAAQDVYDTLSTETSALGRYITDNPGDAEAKALYNSYIEKLNSLQNNLWNSGYNAGTRRDLAIARAGYANDINRLGAAIKARQERSKEFWDSRHKNPNLVTSADPGLDGLDAYLHDDNHGMNWFSYDSAQFEKEVSDEMKSRAKARISDLTDPNGIVSNPKLKSQLTRVINKGLTNEEVDAAGILVDNLINMPASERDRFYAAHSEEISPVVQMLTESLINRYDATGIRGYDVSASERTKLLNRGKAGLAGGVMEPDIKDFDNPEEEFNMWKRKQQWLIDNDPSKGGSSGSGSGSGSGKKQKESPTYSPNALASYIDSDEAKSILSYNYNKFEKGFEAPIPIIGMNGAADVISSPYDANRVLDDLGRKEFMDTYGVDPLNPFGSYKDEEGNTVFIGQYGGGYAGNTGRQYYITVNGKEDKQLTKEFTEDINKFKDTLNAWKDKNEGLDIENLIIREKDWEKMQKESNIPDSVPREAYPYIRETLAGIGYRTPAYLVDNSSDEGAKKARVDFASQLYSSYVRADKDKKGNVSKTSDLAIYKIDSTGKPLYLVRDVRDILGIDGHGDINTDTLQDITASPEDIIDNKIRFTTTRGDSEYSAKPSVFGNAVANVYKDMRKPVYQAYEIERNGKPTIEYEMLDEKGIVHYMMKPILDPVSAFTMTEEETKDWIRTTAATLENYMRFYSTDLGGNVDGVVTPQSIVYSSDLREALRNAVVRYIQAGLGGVTDSYNSSQMFKATSSNPGSSYNLGLNE